MQPLEQPPKDFSHRLIEWLAKLRQRVYDSINSDNFIGTEWDDLTDGGDTVIHKHDRYEDIANKDVSGGYVGKTLEKINFWNTARTFMSFFTNAATAARTYTFPDKDGTVAMTNDKLSTFAATTSAELAGIISDETGSGSVVFSTSPTLVSPILGTPTSGTLDNCTTNTEVAGTNNTHLASTAHVFAERSNTATLTNKTITLDSNTVSGTLAQLNTAITDADIARTDAGQTFTGQQNFAAGTVGSPSIVLGGDTTTGWYRPAANSIAASVSGVEVVRISTTGLEVKNAANIGLAYNYAGGTTVSSSNTTVSTAAIASYIGQSDVTAIAVHAHSSARTTLRYGTALGGFGEILVSGASSNGLMIGTTLNKPIIFGSNAVESARMLGTTFTGAGAIVSSGATSGVGYTTGAGGTVTQATSRTTGVTLNKVTGATTLVSAAGSVTWQSFTVTDSAVAATDVIVVNQKSGTDKNMIHVTAVNAGSFEITFATTGGTTVEQPVFNYAILKGVTA